MHREGFGLQLFGSTLGLFGFGMATINALLQILGSLSYRMQKDRNLFNQDFRAAPARSISYGHIELGPGAFTDFNSEH